MGHREKTKNEKRLIIVLGMHRSGTSALTRSLVELGLSIGEKILEPQPDNPTGFWEDKDIMEINEEILAASGSSWDSFAPPSLDFHEPRMVALLKKAEDLLEQKLKGKDFTFKDPRTIRLLRFWHAVFEKLCIRPSYLLVIRNPLSVGYSLYKRNQFPVVKSFCLWLSHNVSPWPLYAPFLEAVVDYDQFLQQPERDLQRIAEVLSLHYDEKAVLALKRNFLKEEYRHAHFKDQDLEQNQAAFYPLVESWKLLKSMTVHPLPQQAKEGMDRLSREFSAFHDLFGLIDSYYRRQKEITAQLYSKEKKLIEELQDTKHQISELKAKLKQNHLVRNANLKFIAKISRDLFHLEAKEKKKKWGWRKKEEVDPVKATAIRLIESGLFDPGYYWSSYPDVEQSQLDPLLHYIQYGWKEGRNPNGYFDSAYYLEQNADVKAAGVNPLLHFIEQGWKEGRNPHPDFDVGIYLETHPEVKQLGINPLKHFLESMESLESPQKGKENSLQWGQYFKILRSSLFDQAYYLKHNPDVREAGVDPLLHYIQYGWKEGRNPNGYFDSAYYLEQNADVKAAGVNPLLHFIEQGWKEGRNPHPDFDLRYYLRCYPDVKEAQVNPLWHYLVYGQKENRIIRGKTELSFWDNSFLIVPQKKVLLFTDYLLVPDRRGGDFRTFEIIKIIRELGWEVSLATLLDRKGHAKLFKEEILDEQIQHYEEVLFKVGVKKIIYGEKKTENFLSQWGKEFSLAYVFSPTVAYSFIPMIRSYATNAKLIYDPVDLAFVRLEREATLTGDSAVKKEAELVQFIDRANFVGSDVVVAITEEEQEKIKEVVKEVGAQTEVVWIPNIHEICPPTNRWEDRKGILFLGYFGHAPNVDALKFFISEMWGSLRKEIPGCTFDIVGSFLEEFVSKDLLTQPGINPIGYVRELGPYFEQVRVFVSPLRFGAGMKGKIGMAMAFGLPVVTTTIGAEGMKLEGGKTAFICDDKEEFIEAVLKLYKDKGLWESLSQASLEHVEKYFSKPVVKARLKKLFSFSLV
ncbi:glycosyltransferase [Methylacidiphilum caldifontis]|uniref:glycosyltransferase n=1 Tax=Methylacidiphilum caldifontis TaxID=2795386 RepID=UPI001A8E567D|nr:glycosyltransferase [Methylacidiphilum caldifontis]QSR89625.1 glycosyltransferase [Methylacidiphilum caldifontis]